MDYNQYIHNRHNMEYLESKMETLEFDILIFFGTSQKQVLWL